MKKSYFKKFVASLVTTTFLLTNTLPQIQVYGSSQSSPETGFTQGAFNLKAPTITESTLAGRADVTLDWDDYTYSASGDKVETNYFVARRPVYYNSDNATIASYGNWDIRGKYGKTIKVLNIYPNISGSDGFKSWMDTQNANENVDIQVTSQKLSDFNSNPYKYLTKNPNGTYNYDVIVFGFWDSNNKASISSSSANIVQNYINAGYGVLFGHDTIQHSTINLGFNNIVTNNLDLIITPSDRKKWFYSEKIGIRKQGSLTTFPFDINGQDLTVPMTHSVGQLPGNKTTGTPNNDIVYMTFEPNYYPTTGDGPYFNYNQSNSAVGPDPTITYNGKKYIGNAYLYKQDNVAFIQSGHSSGKTSEAEQMVLANLMYALAQIQTGTSEANDQVLDDISPTTPTDLDKNLKFESADSGSGYEYRIIAVPVGYDVSSINKSNLQIALSSDIATLDSKVMFSNSYLTGELISQLKGSPSHENETDQATYRYYIDKNAMGTRIPPVEIAGKEDLKDDFYTLGYNEAFDYTKHFTSVSKIADNDYLHVVSFDRANNASSIANFRLKEYLTNVDVTVNCSYTDASGNTQSISKTYLGSENPEQIAGTMYSNTPEQNLVIDGVTYIYSHSSPSTNYITLDKDSTKNVITHYYDKLVTKNIYLVEERPEINQGSGISRVATENVVLYKTATLKTGSTVNISQNRPNLTTSNYTFQDWNSGNTQNYNNGVGLNTDTQTYKWEDDSNNIYLYYTKDVATVNVEVKRSDDIAFTNGGAKTFTYSRQGFVGENLVITGAEIKSKITLPNLQAYTNKSDLDNYRQTVKLTTKDAIYTNTISLTPRTLNLRANGVEYTSSSAIYTKDIYTRTATYEYDTTTVVHAPATIDDWKNINNETSGEDLMLDFTTTSDILTTYYKGVKPSEAYTVTANYKNIIDNSTVKTSSTANSLNIANPPNIPVNKEVTVTAGISGVTRPVDFTLDHYEVTLNGVKTTFSKDTDINNVVPYKNANGTGQIGNYTVDIYYMPYAQITHTEKLYNSAGTNVVAEKSTMYNVLYDGKTYTLDPILPTSDYIVKVNNVVSDTISAEANNYDVVVTTTYTPKVYNLKVILRNNANLNARDYQSYSFENIPISNAVEFVPPDYENSGYSFYKAQMETTQNSDITSNTASKIVFDPQVNPENGTTYTMDLIYKQKSTIIGTYTAYKGGAETITGDIEAQAYIGDPLTITLPYIEGYELTSAYFDGKQVRNASGGTTLDGTVTKPIHYIDVVYRELSYDLNVETMTTGGEGLGTGTYYPGEKVYVYASANDGYLLDKVVVEEQDVELATTSGLEDYAYFLMPAHDVNIQVYFKPVTTVTPVDPSNPTEEVDKEDETETTDKEEEVVEEVVEDETDLEDIEKIIPEKPINPTPEDIYSLVNDPYFSIVRQYKPYISGYPSGEVHPSGEITRGEVIAILYNLYGNGYVSDKKSLAKFSDVSSEAWYSDAIAFSVDFGIVSGYSDGTYKPNQPITRGELAAIIAKFVDSTVVSETSNFSDVASNWAASSIQKLYEKGIVGGYVDGTFKPKATTKRSEFVSILSRLIQRPDNFNENIEFPDLPETHWAYNSMMNAANGSVVDLALPESLLKDINIK